jgi:nitroreductase
MSSEKINKPREGIPRGRCGKSMGVTPWRRLLKIGLKKLRIGLYSGGRFCPSPTINVEVLTMDVMETIKGRRSIRKYKSEPIPDEILGKVLEAARWSPSWANTQCWEVIVIRDPEKKGKVAEILPPRNPALSDAPVLLVFCAIRNLSGFKGGEAATDKGDWFMFDVGVAMENLCLAAHSLGLGTVIIGLFDAKKVETLLGVPENISVVAMTPLGYPRGEVSAPRRKEPGDFVHDERYGESWAV